MFRNRRRSRITRVAVAGAAALLAVAIAACSNSSGSGSSGGSPTAAATGAKVAGGTVTYGLKPQVTLSYIFPFTSIANVSSYTVNQFQWLMYRPLYVFGNNGQSIQVNYPISPANAPVYSDGGKTVTINFKSWKWSNGEAVDANDLIFWLNMMKAQKANYYGYAPGLAPDNITSYSATGPEQVTLHLNAAYSALWFTYNQLAEFTPMPMAWDVTSLGAKAGSGGCTTDTAKDNWAKCTAVYNFLSAQAKQAGSYATSPLWGVVDAPWKLSVYNANGNVTMVPNTSYSGPQKPTISAIKFVPFTSDAAEYTALKTGSIDIAQIPPQDLPNKPESQPLPSTNPLGSSYNLVPFYPYGIYYFQPNFNNPTFGAVFKQLYVRQALQMLMDQQGDGTAFWHGYAYPESGPVPTKPANQWTPAVETTNGGLGPYPFNVSKAKSLLTSHGWSEVNGVMTCQTPALCGAGISKGQKLAFSVNYATGQQDATDQVENYKSDAAQAGVQVSLIGQSFDTVVGMSNPCKPGPKCTWDVLWFGGWGYNGPGFEPTGENLFATGSGSNSGSYSDPTMDKLIGGTHTNSSLSAFEQYATYASQELPFIWTTNEYSIYAATNKLANVQLNPLYTLFPEDWYFTK
jgi:peptide/nickel transport system substrate-binding protein